MRKKVLIVEDNLPILETIEDYVARDGFETVKAMTGQEAFESLSKERYDLVLLDLNLPDINGLSLLKKECAKPVAPVFIVITGVGQIDVIMDCINAGASDFITKPVTYERLSISIKNALEKRTLSAKHGSSDLTKKVKYNVEKYVKEEEKKDKDRVDPHGAVSKGVLQLPDKPQNVWPMLQYQLAIILATLKVCEGDVNEAARLLQMSKTEMNSFIQLVKSEGKKASG